MTLRLRRIIYISIFLVFFIVGPLLAAYARGLRYDIRNRRITTVGAIYVKSYPSGSSIAINGKKTNKRTPTRILNLLPNEYRVTVTRDGFKSWEKTLPVEAGQTTFIRDVVLFFENPTTLRLSNGGSSAVTNANETSYAFLDADRTIHFTSLITETDYPITAEPLPDELLALSPAADTLLYRHTNEWYLVNVYTEKVTRLGPAPKKASRITWDPYTPNRVWYISDVGIVRHTLSTNTPELRYTTADDFIIERDSIYTFEQAADASRLAEYRLDGDEPVWTMALATTGSARLHDKNPDGLLTLTTPEKLTLVDTRDSSFKTFDASYFAWKDSRLLYATPFEISLYDDVSGNTTLIDRSSTALDVLRWHPSGSYIIWRKDGVLSLVELDSRDVRNITSLSAATGPIPQLFFDTKGSRLFILDQESNRLLELQE